MTQSACANCATPLASTERRCPVCGQPRVVAPPPTALKPGNRRIVGLATTPSPISAGPPPAPLAPRPPTSPSVAPLPPHAVGLPSPQPGAVLSPSSTSAALSAGARGRGAPKVDGVISGPVVTDQVFRSAMAGRMMLRIAIPIAIIVALIAVVLALRKTFESLFFALLPIIVLIFLIRFVFLGNRRGRRDGRGRAGHLMGNTLSSGARGVGSLVSHGSTAGGGMQDATTEVRRFRVDSIDGRRTDCEMTGELRGPPLRQGDHVHVFGRSNRRGVIVARRIVLVATRGVATAHPPLTYRLARAGTVIALLLCLAILLAVVFR